MTKRLACWLWGLHGNVLRIADTGQLGEGAAAVASLNSDGGETKQSVQYSTSGHWTSPVVVSFSCAWTQWSMLARLQETDFGLLFKEYELADAFAAHLREGDAATKV
jgi:hypothetical protein